MLARDLFNHSVIDSFPELSATARSEEHPGEDGAGGYLDRVLAELERREIMAALQRTHGQRSETAKALGVSRSRLYRRMEALGIDPKDLPFDAG